MEEKTMESDRVILVNRKKKATTKEELECFTREELIDRALQLQAHNVQLLNILKKERQTQNQYNDVSTAATTSSEDSSGKRKWEKEGQRKFNFPTSFKRHILLKFYYLGWNYQGFTVQEHTINTIEHHLFESLKKVCLIENRETSNYHRCGRTDKGVSAFSQVISIDVRSKLSPEKQCDPEALKNEINYCEALNRVLPKNIKCVAWAPLKNSGYSARFDCKWRTYRYFFPRGSMNIDAMKDACKQFVGIHDYRNVCKMDVANGVVTFMREIKSADIIVSNLSRTHSSYDMLYLELVGTSYLWHQVRCIMAILMLVGEKKESPNIVATLLNVENTPCTPQYSMASDVPLNLYNVEYKDLSEYENEEEYENVQWIHDELNLRRVITSLQAQWTISSVQSTMMQEMLANLHQIYENEINGPKLITQLRVLLEGVQPRIYQPLMSRTKCESLENRIAHYAKKRRIEIQAKPDEMLDES